MPMHAPRICGCGLRIAYGETCICQRRRKAEHDASRPSARARGYDSRWDRERAAFLRDRPLCERMVDGRGCCKPANVVHHVVPHRGDARLFWDRSNWSPRCQPCHDRAEQAAERRAAPRGGQRLRRDGWGPAGERPSRDDRNEQIQPHGGD